MGRQIKAVRWFTGGTNIQFPTVGMVLTENDQGEQRLYIGSGLGVDEKIDAELIADMGVRIEPHELIEFISQGIPRSRKAAADLETLSIPWLDPSWEYRKAIVINHKMVVGSFTDFWIQVNTEDPDIDAAIDAQDVAFTAADGQTKLDHNIEDDGPGHRRAWVRIPELLGSRDLVLFAYHGRKTDVDTPAAGRADGHIDAGG
jgi:hypothetical protein